MSEPTYRVSRLPNGVRVASIAMPHMRSVSVGLWAGVGGRHESAGESGVSHFLEHLTYSEGLAFLKEVRRVLRHDGIVRIAVPDAALLIGDRALKFQEENERPNAEHQRPLLRLGAEPLVVFDLAERWRFLTGLPFVFAFWAVRDGFKDQSVVDTLKQSRDFGVRNIPVIAEKYSEPTGIKKEYIQEYLEQNMHYYMDQSCIDGLVLFYEKAARIGAVKGSRSLEFV
jgi:SAM-dependent methyltransferase